MSERGSFVTEYMCGKCFDAARNLFFGDPVDSGSLLPVEICGSIIAGKIKSSWEGGEIFIMEELLKKLSPLLCHEVRVAVLAEDGEKIITAKPFDTPQ